MRRRPLGIEAVDTFSGYEEQKHHDDDTRSNVFPIGKPEPLGGHDELDRQAIYVRPSKRPRLFLAPIQAAHYPDGAQLRAPCPGDVAFTRQAMLPNGCLFSRMSW